MRRNQAFPLQPCHVIRFSPLSECLSSCIVRLKRWQGVSISGSMMLPWLAYGIVPRLSTKNKSRQKKANDPSSKSNYTPTHIHTPTTHTRREVITHHGFILCNADEQYINKKLSFFCTAIPIFCFGVFPELPDVLLWTKRF